MDGGGGEGEAGDAVPKTRTPHGDVGKNRLKYQHVGCKLPLEATFLYFSQIFVCVCVSSCWRPSVQDLFEVDGTTFFRVTWGQVTNVGMYTMHKSCHHFFGSRTIKSY